MNFLALIMYLVIMGITPGPNNLVLASSGVNFGFSRTVPALMGMALGLGVQVGAITLLLGSLVAWITAIQIWLALAGCLYLLWLAWGMAHAGRPGEARAARPIGFVGGVLFNWLNPKVWLMGFNITMVFLPSGMDPWRAALLFSVATFATSLPCIAVWAGGGVVIARFLHSPLRLRAFNCTMAAMLTATAVWLLVQMLPADSFAAIQGMV
ncbi:LysE family translocator [Paludibacterium paludis]|uniref:Membrane protein n=1 Tax=Paludibacterium paludis TaxID=1225769 RepID=A0A918P0E1_9NEIS|nr:LysE family translocator [Paludibacterium paludis]GGY10918.1 membrane protein [Paludibacterium paludis]